LFIAVGLAMTGVGIKLSALHAGQQTLPAGVRWALCGGAALFLLALAAVRAVAIGGVRDRLLATRALACAAIIACGAVGGLISPLVLNMLVSAVLFSAVVADVLRLTPEDEDPHQLASDPPLDRDVACGRHAPTCERDLRSGDPFPAGVA
jgi:low temperature requirement protein LtrA